MHPYAYACSMHNCASLCISLCAPIYAYVHTPRHPAYAYAYAYALRAHPLRCPTRASLALIISLSSTSTHQPTNKCSTEVEPLQ